jgi:CYTH domain-containing protein
MATEIERKFLVKDDGWRAGAGDGTRYRQGYICRDDRSSLRVRVSGDSARIAIKARKEEAGGAVARYEYEYDIERDDAVEMLDELATGSVIEKTRYKVDHAGLTWEIDVFEGDNAPLVLAEVELESADQQVDLPPWIGAEVTTDKRYFNVHLADHPYSTWEASA